MKKIILASSSPRRKQLLEQIGLPFEILASNIDEVLDSNLSPEEQVKELSRQKAFATAQLPKAKNTIIVAADTMVVIGTEILGKPKDKNDAKRMLNLLSDKRHEIMTGYTIYDEQTKKSVAGCSITNVWFRELSAEEIDTFTNTVEPYDKAGAYGLQEKAAVFIEKIEGDYAGAVGLPLFLLAKHLQEFGIKVL